jgi:hypothetical protein
MPDLKQRLDAVDQVPVDDLWPEIRERVADEAAGKVTPLRRSDRSGLPEVGWRKALTIAAVFAVLAAAGFVLVRSLTSDGVPATPPAEPRPAPAASGSLVYALRGDIWVADPDGTNAVRITDVDALDDECPGDVAYGGPLWSPDGRYIASLFGECVDSPRVVITDPQGNVVANFPVAERFRAWSPDSTRIAVWDEWGRDEDGGPFTIGIYGIDGTRETQIALRAAGGLTYLRGRYVISDMLETCRYAFRVI